MLDQLPQGTRIRDTSRCGGIYFIKTQKPLTAKNTKKAAEAAEKYKPLNAEKRRKAAEFAGQAEWRYAAMVELGL